MVKVLISDKLDPLAVEVFEKNGVQVDFKPGLSPEELLAIIPEFFMHHHASFEKQGITLDTSFGFYAWYGFLTCAAMVVGAKVLAVVLKRKDDYYDE